MSRLVGTGEAIVVDGDGTTGLAASPVLTVATGIDWRTYPLVVNGVTINTEPAGWKLASFDASSWAHAVVVIPNVPGGTPPPWTGALPGAIPAGQIICDNLVYTTLLGLHVGDGFGECYWLARTTYSLASPAGALLTAGVDDTVDVFFNGTTVASFVYGTVQTGTADLSTSVAGANAVGLKIHNVAQFDPNWDSNPTWVDLQADIPLS